MRLLIYKNHEIFDYNRDLLYILRFSMTQKKELGVSNGNRHARRRNVSERQFVIE